jgi:hypothetical protein
MKMIKFIQNIHPIVFLIIATLLEVAGDTIIRKSIYNHTGMARMGLMFLGAMLLFGYGFVLNLTPVQFGQVVGLYIATLFVVWQIGNYIAFHTVPTLPIIAGGILIITGGLIVTFWKSP